MNKWLEGEWETIKSPKPKMKGCVFIRLKGQRDAFICKVYCKGKEEAEEIAARTCECVNNFTKMKRRSKNDKSI